MLPSRPVPAADSHLARAQALGPALAAAAETAETERQLPASLQAALHEAGFFRMLRPRWLGGDGIDPLTYIAVIEEIARHDASAAWCINQATGCAMAAGYVSTEVAHEIFGGRDAVLAWGPSPQARAVAVEGGYRVDYAGTFASGSRHATWLGAHCPVQEADGTTRRDANGQIEIRTMLFPKSRAVMQDVWHVLGLRGTGSDSFRVEGLLVPAEHSLVRDDEATRRALDPIYRMSSNMIYAAGFASVALGIARAMLDGFLDIALDKTPRGMGRRLRDSAVIQADVATSEAKWQASRSWLHACVGNIWETVQQQPRATMQQRMALRLAATYAQHEAKAVVDTIHDAAGATAIFESNPFARRFRDIHTVTQQVQGRKAFFEEVGRFMFGLDANTVFL